MIEEDHCVYVKRSEGSFIILSLYVKDILLAKNNKEFIKTIKEWLSSTFEMKDMGEALCLVSRSSETVRESSLVCPKRLT